MTFDLDYRPKRFKDVLGNEGIKKLLLTRSRDGSLGSQSYLFGGPKGCGKTTLARIVARAIKCSDLQDGEPCGSCPSCLSIIDETNPDVEELDAASQGTVDKIRGMVKDADYGTFDGTDSRVYIVDEAQRLSKAAQDAFLKAVEARLFVVILCTTEPKKIADPIVDRLEELPVKPPSVEDMARRLSLVCDAEGIQADPSCLEGIVRMSELTPRKSLLALESLSKIGPITPETLRDYYRLGSYELVDETLRLLDSDPVAALSALDRLSSRESPTWIRDAVVSAIAGGLRVDIGSSSRFPVPTNFFKVRGRGWLSVSRELSGVDRPSLADIEAALLSDCPIIPVHAPPPIAYVNPAPAPPPAQAPPAQAPPQLSEASPPPVLPKPSPTPTPTPTPSPAVELDGVLFRRDEILTSLDDKIRASSTPQVQERPSVKVESDKSRAPISEGEFASSFRRRVRS